jgi:hypothetical protein
MDQHAQGDIIESHEVSAMLKISPWTLAKWTTREENPIPSVKLGWRTRRYSRAAVTAWFAAQGKK